MKAVLYDRIGPARDVLKLTEMEIPTASAGEVLVRLFASGVNPSDVKLRAGTRAGDSCLQWPFIIPHSDGAGVVEAVGKGVDKTFVGKRVWIWNGQWERQFGTAAEFIALPLQQAVPLPDSVSFTEGACLGIPAMTAHHCVFADGAVQGQTILVTGGAGAVGRYAVQMAKLGGATVITTVSGPEKAKHAQTAGADHVLNYRKQDVVAAILELTSGKGVNRVVDGEFGANLPVTARVIRPNGVIAAYGSRTVMKPELPFYSFLKEITLRIVLVYILPANARRKAIDDISQFLADGQLSNAVARIFPLQETAAAHEFVENGDKLGSVVIAIA
jgi:NADPH2:quinone reductase